MILIRFGYDIINDPATTCLVFWQQSAHISPRKTAYSVSIEHFPVLYAPYSQFGKCQQWA